MKTLTRRSLAVAATCAVGIGLAPRVEARSPHKHAIVFALLGFGAGFGIGTAAGLDAYDDAINSDRKVWTSALVAGGVGGALGWAWGAHVDHRHAAASARSLDARLEQALAAGRAPLRGSRDPGPAITRPRDLARRR
jgi:hypothetical protein